jgi:class 3 adenylate cyclase
MSKQGSMAIVDELKKEVARVFRERWDVQSVESVPETEDLVLSSNHAKELEDCTVLYADLAASTHMVDAYKWGFSAEIYKNYLHCAASLIRMNGGNVTAYDGDRVMAIYIGGSKNSAATRTAFNIQWAVTQVINPALRRQYENTEYSVSSVIGIDSSILRATRTGVRKHNDVPFNGCQLRESFHQAGALRH